LNDAGGIKKKGSSGEPELPFFHPVSLLFRVDRLNRAHVGAGAAIGAHFRVNFIDIALRNSFHRAFINAGTASGAIVVDFVSHDFKVYVLRHQGQVNNAFFGTNI